MLMLGSGSKLFCILFICSIPDWLQGVVEGQIGESSSRQSQGQGQIELEIPAGATEDSTPRPAIAPGQGQGQTEIVLPPSTDGPDPSDAETTEAGECREQKYPCTRLYSVHKPLKECIKYLCVTSVRRVYVINKEVCSRVVCKEDEEAQDEICRQQSGLPPRRFRRSSDRPCKRAAGELQAPHIP